MVFTAVIRTDLVNRLRAISKTFPVGVVHSSFEWKTDLCGEAADEIERLRGILDKLLRVKAAADGGDELLSNQGQALDGYSELANYRSILDKTAPVW